jgi:hypothetical protein
VCAIDAVVDAVVDAVDDAGAMAAAESERRAFEGLRLDCERLHAALQQHVSSAKTHLVELADIKELAQSHLKSMSQTQQLLVIQAQAQLQTFAHLSQVSAGFFSACCLLRAFARGKNCFMPPTALHLSGRPREQSVFHRRSVSRHRSSASRTCRHPISSR